MNALLSLDVDVDPLRLGSLWLESDLKADPEVFSSAAQCASSRLDFAAAERFARAAFDIDPNDRNRRALAYIDYMNGNGAEVERILPDAETVMSTAEFINPAQAAAVHRAVGRRGSSLTANSRAQLLARQCGGAESPALHAARITLPLTRREHEIVLLVAKGLSNREIAEATSLSVRTVEGHALRATQKAAVSGRSELATVIGTGIGG